MSDCAILRHTTHLKEVDYLRKVNEAEVIEPSTTNIKPPRWLPILGNLPVSFRVPHCLDEIARRFSILNTVEVYSRLSAHAARACGRHQRQLLVTVWETIPGHPSSKFPPYRQWGEETAKRAHRFVAQTQRAARYLRETYGVEDKTVVIYPGVNLEEFAPSDDSADTQEKRVLFTGRLEPQKGVADLIKSFKLAQDSHPDAELWICGDGSIRHGVQRICSKQRGMRYLGWMRRNRLPQVLKQCSIFCMPSLQRRVGPFLWWEEQFGFSAVEAMACSLPVVAYKSGAIPEIVGDHNALIQQADVFKLADALHYWMDNPNEARDIGTLNRERAETLFDSHRAVQEYSELIQSLS